MLEKVIAFMFDSAVSQRDGEVRLIHYRSVFLSSMTTLVVPGLLRLGLGRGSLLRAVISLVGLLLPCVHLLFNALLPALRVRDPCELRLEHL